MATILITGGGSGFGKGTALGLARKGHSVIAGAEIWPQVWDLREEAAELGVELAVIKLDLLDEIDRENALEHDIDILVNNAGIMETGPMAEIPIERVRSVFETNVFSHLELTQGFVRKMIDQGHGKVVWVSSIAGLKSSPFGGTYAASKHAIEAIAAAMREELKPTGVKVATINPGPYRTGFNDTGAESKWQWYDRDESAVPAPDGLESSLDSQSDPQEMIDLMVEVIPAESHLYRTVSPDSVEDQVKEIQASEWTAKV